MPDKRDVAEVIDSIIGHLYDADDAFTDYHNKAVLKDKIAVTIQHLDRAVFHINALKETLTTKEEENG